VSVLGAIMDNQYEAGWEWQQQLLDQLLMEETDEPASQQVLAGFDNDFNKLFVGSSDNDNKKH